MILKVSEFAEKIGAKPQSVNTWGRRGKLLIINGKLDTEHPANKLFVDLRFNRYVADEKEIEEKPVIQNDEPEKIIPVEEKPERVSTNNTESAYEGIRLLDKLRALKYKEDIRSLKLKNEVVEGKLVPVDLVKKSVSEIVMRFKTAFLQQSEQLTRDVLNELQADNKIITLTCTKLIDVSNEVSRRALQETEIVIGNIIDEMTGK